MKQGSPPPSLNGADLIDVIDLDAELAGIDLSPRPLKLSGVTYQLRRDLTFKEQQEFFRLLRSPNDVDDAAAMAILVGDDAAALTTVLEQMPQQRMQRAVQVILQKAGLAAEDGGQGEAKAS